MFLLFVSVRLWVRRKCNRTDLALDFVSLYLKMAFCFSDSFAEMIPILLWAMRYSPDSAIFLYHLSTVSLQGTVSFLSFSYRVFTQQISPSLSLSRSISLPFSFKKRSRFTQLLSSLPHFGCSFLVLTLLFPTHTVSPLGNRYYTLFQFVCQPGLWIGRLLFSYSTQLTVTAISCSVTLCFYVCDNALMPASVTSTAWEKKKKK